MEKTFPLAATLVMLALTGLSASLLFPSEGVEVRNLTMEEGVLIEADEITMSGTLSPGEGELLIELSTMKAKNLRLHGKITMGAGEARAENIRVVADPSSLENEGVGAFLLLVMENGERIELRGLRMKNLRLFALSMRTGKTQLKGLRLG